ncbi:MAG: thioredoxin domain-containing protein [Clostridia bacterium]|nr:thioredoxin domain-containing protein [Clostridia bacterium]
MSNHLICETSPYLLQHAQNPVDWYPWGEEAFQKARTEDKPVFLSIGYSTCHWCHVMAHESFEDERTAALLNRGFVSIKVDREERPDIDSVYMAACQAMTGSGGWPTSLFLTPDKKPFYAGTYFPKTARYGMPGFCDLLEAILDAWMHDRVNLLQSADAVASALTETEKTHNKPETDLILKACSTLQSSFDSTYGGFGRAPKFPSPHNLLFLLQQYEKNGDRQALFMATLTLERMYAGGMFDHIGGGFCRYSTDRRFLVPHFEKMLYDNALLILVYSKAFELTGDSFYLDVAEQTAAYLLREMQSKEGGFFCAQDADSDGEEGRYYLLTPEETVAVLGKDAGEAFNACYDITEEGNFAGKSIPNLLNHPRQTKRFESEKQALLRYRKKRAPLRTDDKQLTFWNALAITGMCALFHVSQNPEYLRAAVQAYWFVQRNLKQGETLFTSFRNGKTGSRAFLDDHAGLALAELSLYAATLDQTYLDAAVWRAQTAIDEFFDVQAGGFFFSGPKNETLLIRSKESYDGAMPSGNSIMAYVLTRLSTLAPDRISKKLPEKQMTYMKHQAASAPMGFGMFLVALSDYEQPPVEVVAVCAQEDAGMLPALVPLGANLLMLERETSAYPLLDGKKTYYVCRGFTCLPPANELKKDWLLSR